MVVLYHTSGNWSIITTGTPHFVWWAGRAGVDIFFVISGFVMAITTIGKGEGAAAAGKFLERRLLRFIPLYWVATSLVLLRELISPMHNTGPHPNVTLIYVVCSYFLIPHFNGMDSSHPLLDVGWTLSFELLFYFCFAAALGLRRAVAPFLSILLTIIVIAGYFRQPSWPAIFDLASPLLLEFLAGVWIARAVQTRKTLSPQLSAALGAVGLLVLVAASFLQPIHYVLIAEGFAAVLIVNAAIILEPTLKRHLPRPLLLVGDASYSLYLTHQPLLILCFFLLKRFHLVAAGRTSLLSLAISLVLCLAFAISAGIYAYVIVEKPVTKWVRRLFNLRKPLQVSSSPIATGSQS